MKYGGGGGEGRKETKAITFEPIRGSGASSKRFFTRVAFVGVDLLILPCIDSWTNEHNE